MKKMVKLICLSRNWFRNFKFVAVNANKDKVMDILYEITDDLVGRRYDFVGTLASVLKVGGEFQVRSVFTSQNPSFCF